MHIDIELVFYLELDFIEHEFNIPHDKLDKCELCFIISEIPHNYVLSEYNSTIYVNVENELDIIIYLDIKNYDTYEDLIYFLEMINIQGLSVDELDLRCMINNELVINISTSRINKLLLGNIKELIV